MKEYAHELAEILKYNSFDVVHQNIRGSDYFINPIPDYETVLQRSHLLDCKNRIMVEFFLLGRKVRTVEMLNYFADALNCLEGLHVVKRDGIDYVQLDELILISYQSCFFFVSTPYSFPHCISNTLDVYVGPDTYYLANNLYNENHETILDLCTGSGIQLILGCKKACAKHGVGVDINDNACKIARINVSLNAMDEIIDIKSGDLYDPVGSELFDLIYSNPPFIPVPQTVQYPLCGDGGEFGLDVLKTIISGLNSHLTKNGKVLVFGEMLGTDNEWLISKYLCSSDSTLRYKLLILGCTDIITQIDRTSSVATRLNNFDLSMLKKSWEARYRDLSITRYGSFLLYGQNGVIPSYHEVQLYSESTFAAQVVPHLLVDYKSTTIDDTYIISFSNGNTISVDRTVFEFIEFVKTNEYYTIKDFFENMRLNKEGCDCQSLLEQITFFSRKLGRIGIFALKEAQL